YGRLSWRIVDRESVILRALDTDASGAFCGKGLRHLVSNIYPDGRIAAGAGIVKVAANPAVLLIFFRVACGMPDFGRAKVGAIWIRVADGLHRRKMAFVVKGFDVGEFGVQCVRVVGV